MKKKRKKVSAAVVLALFLIVEQIVGVPHLAVAKDAEEKAGSLYALSAVLMDAKTGRVLLGKEEDVARPMASTTKIMTCILALEEGWQDDIVLVSKYAENQPKVHAGIQENEQYWLEDLLYSLMLESHNDSAVAIAEHIAGSVEAFAEMMNQKAAKIGCTSAHFVTPNGLDASDELGVHSISAADLARIMSYCVLESPKAEKFLEITQTRSYIFQEITGKRTVSCTNHNALLDMVEGAVSGKTGFTGNAGYCYVGAVESEERMFVVALLGCGWPSNKNYKWVDSKKLISYGKENYYYEKIEKDLDTTFLEVKNGIPQTGLFEESIVRLGLETEEECYVLKSKEEEVHMTEEVVNYLEAPVKEGEKIGKQIYYIGTQKCKECAIIVEENADEKTFKWTFTKIIELYLSKCYTLV